MPDFSTKRKLCLLAIVCMALTLCVGLSAARAEAPAGDILRLHVIANSDATRDQTVKLRVRDAILTHMPPCDSAAEAEAYLLTHGQEILLAAERTLAADGLPYGAQLMLGTSAFPERTYDRLTFPAGDYRALKVILGRGAGQNWWCVLFPPLCIVTTEREELPAVEDIEFESTIAQWVRTWRDGK